jgi:hypothetical protein
MQKYTIAAAVMAAVCAAVLAFNSIAAAQNVVDPSIVHHGAVELTTPASGGVDLTAPMPALGAEFERAEVPDDGEVQIPYGDWVSSILTWLLGVAGIAAAWLLRRLPATIVSALDAISGALGQGRANELLEKAITYGINTTAGAIRGKTLTVKVGMEVLERALEYAVRHAPAFVAWAGGAIAVREKIIARLDLEADAELPAPKPPADTLVTAPAS